MPIHSAAAESIGGPEQCQRRTEAADRSQPNRRSEERRVGKECSDRRAAVALENESGGSIWKVTGNRSASGKVFCFSSRRRHTRWPRDWSSDVCSSDLEVGLGRLLGHRLSGGRTECPFIQRPRNLSAGRSSVNEGRRRPTAPSRT